MNKIFKSVLLVVTIVTTFGSCVKNDIEPYDPVDIYKRNFKAYIGGEVNSNQTWGFSSTSAARTASTSSATRATGATVDINTRNYTNRFTKDYFKTVMEYFPEGAECKSKDYLSYEFRENATYCNVQLIYTNTKSQDEIGFYYYDPRTETFENKTEVKMIDNIQENISYWFKYSQYEEGDNWRTDGQPDDGYKLWTEYGTKRIISRTFTISMNAEYYFGFYVKNNTSGKTYYSNNFLNENEEIAGGLYEIPYPENQDRKSYVFGLSDDGKPGSEILLAMIQAGEGGLYPTPVKPAKPEPKPEPLQWKRIICEDLNVHDLQNGGSTNDTDFDFNDIVLDVALTKTGASCILQAAGATLQIRVNGDDNIEVHKLFGVAQNVMVNTDAEKHGMTGVKKDPVKFDLTGSFPSIKDIKIEVFKDNRWIELTAPKGDAASKIAVDTDFEWPYERQSLKLKFPDFPRYAKDNVDIDNWWKGF